MPCLPPEELRRWLPGLDLRRAKRYSRLRLGLWLAGLGYGLARQAWFARSGSAARLERAIAARAPDQRLVAPAFVAAATAGAWLTDLPLGLAGGYLVERSFGLTRQTPRGWLVDQTKGLLVGLALQTPLATAALAVIRRRPRDWWLWLAGAVVPLAVVGSQLAPVLILPIFNRFRPLRDPALAARLEALAARAGVPIAAVLEMDMSRQTEKANAFFAGLGRTKRIVLADTLIERFPPAEVEAVVAHELGHQVHGDIWRLIALAGGLGFGAAYGLSRLVPRLAAHWAGQTGVRRVDDPAALPLYALVGGLLGLVAAPIQNGVSRAIERRTDRYAVGLTGDGPTYAATMARLAEQNLADPDPSPLVVVFLYSHPPVAERIAAALAPPGGASNLETALVG